MMGLETTPYVQLYQLKTTLYDGEHKHVGPTMTRNSQAPTSPVSHCSRVDGAACKELITMVMGTTSMTLHSTLQQQWRSWVLQQEG